MTDNHIEMSELITIDELCKILNIGTSTAYRLLQEHSIDAFKIGKVWKIPKKSVNIFIENQLSG